MERHEHIRIGELGSFAEAVDHNSRHESGFHTEQFLREANKPNETEFVAMVSERPRQNYGTLTWATALLAQCAAKILKALILIFNKLDSIESLLIAQEMRERTKEGR